MLKGRESLDEEQGVLALVEQGQRNSLQDWRVRDAEGGREEKERPGCFSKGRQPRSDSEDPKALGDQRANGEEARHELSRSDYDG